MYRIALILLVLPSIGTAQAPTQATISGFDGALECGGSMIHERWILTAASCFNAYYRDGNTLIINVGGYNFGYERVIIHPNYVENNADNDIALMRLDVNVPNVQRTLLDFNDAHDYRGQTLFNRGEALQVVEESSCAGFTYNYQKLICAMLQVPQNCQIVPGTPIYLNNRQIGLDIAVNQCGNRVQAFTRVSRYSDWLMNQLAVYGNQILQ